MPQLKRVPTLGVLANTLVSKSVASACSRIEEEDGQGCETLVCDLNQILTELPTNLLETIILTTTSLLTKQVDRCRNSLGLPTALQLLPQPAVTQLDFGQLFTGARLSRALNTQCRASLQTSLGRTVHLTRLVLSSKCTNSILETLGRNCAGLIELHISLSEMVTDAGVAWLVPCVSQTCREGEVPGDGDVSPECWTPHTGCPMLLTVDLLKCWNVTPSGAQILLLGLKKLRKLLFSNMKSVMEGILHNDDAASLGPFLLEYFDSSEYDLITSPDDLYSLSATRPDTNPACWLSGPVHLAHIPRLFPHITILRMMLSDAEVKSLTLVSNLIHLEVEFSDDPGVGLQHLLDSHPNISKFIHLFLQVGPIQGSHLLSIAQNCVQLSFLRIIGFQVENTTVLKPSCKYFPSLSQFHLSLYDDSYGDSSDEEDVPAQISRHTPDIIEFFLFSSTKLHTVNIHMNFDAFLNDQFLHKLFSQNPLQKLAKLSLSGPTDLNLTISTVKWVVESLPNLQSLCVSKWNIADRALKTLRNYARRNNIDLVYD
eukprot:GFUD01021044.1.p1 GENE.GFUD01021044.1~~GFUD01021044.1.p1  ORF type:complete len:542 (-),score=137.32 GFUD01021044.1:103-1728(-)